MKRVAIFTGSRAEYGLLRPLIQRVQDESSLELQLIVSGMHLSPDFGMTVNEVEKEFPIAKKVEIDLSSDTPSGICRSTGEAVLGLGKALEELRPDLVILLGDRFEALGMATSAMLHCIPIAHLHGGELTEGAVDDSIRHAITKMSHLHFTSTEEYRDRVIQLGEDPKRVFCSGAIGLDSLKSVELMSREELEKDLGVPLEKFFLVTFHPVTLEANSSVGQCQDLLEELLSFEDFSIVITKANADAEGRAINQFLEEFAGRAPERVVLCANLGLKRYASAMSLAKAVVGNSSSGILEAPFFGTPTLDVGDRQKGRIAPPSVIHCEAERPSIKEGLEKIIQLEYNHESSLNPYGKGNATNLIMKVILSEIDSLDSRKSFHDLQKSL